MVSTEHIVEQYRRYLMIQRSVHPETAKRYIRHVGKWIAFLAMKGKNLCDATEDDAAEWYEQTRRGYHPNTMKDIIESVRNFHAWLSTKDPHAPPNYFAAWRVPSVMDYVRPYLSEDQVRAILELPIYPSPADIRDRALFAFLISTGARISEALSMNVTDLAPQDRRAWLRITKLREARSSLLMPLAWRMVALYLRSARPVLLGVRSDASKERALWISNTGRRMGREAARIAIIRLCEEAGIPIPVTPHGLRKTVATHVYRRSKDLMLVKELLGHKSLRSTERYLASVHDQELDRAAKVHPLRDLEPSWLRRLLDTGALGMLA